MASAEKKLILFSGGGTAGSVSPLLAIYDELQSLSAGSQAASGFEFFWIGTRNGIEKEMVKAEGIPFQPIFSGKFRRYFSLKNLSDVFFLKLGFFQSLYFMLCRRPDLVLSAGAFVSVPVVWAAWILRIPVMIHQQDIRPGLANKLMAPFARAVSVSFEKSLADFGSKARWIGNPARKFIADSTHGVLGQNPEMIADFPILLVVGGGTGAFFINRLIRDSLEELTKFCQVIHVTGKNKMPGFDHKPGKFSANYRAFEFLSPVEMARALKNADLVITRAGMSFLTELSAAGKPAIIIPIPDSHQEDNARYFADREAGVVLEQKDLIGQALLKITRNLLNDPAGREKLVNNISRLSKPKAAKDLSRLIFEIIG